MPKAVLFWSSGKDSALAFHRKRNDIVALVTTVTEKEHRVAMHGVREALLDAQAEAMGVPLEKIRLPWPCPNPVYEEKVAASLKQWQGHGITHVVFGDLFLEEIRRYREAMMAPLGFTPVFPLWGEDTRELAREFINEGFGAVLTCVDLRKLDAGFAGKHFNKALLAALPAEVDPCGENGEFHTFVYRAPFFSSEIPLNLGHRFREGDFGYIDLTSP